MRCDAQRERIAAWESDGICDDPAVSRIRSIALRVVLHHHQHQGVGNGAANVDVRILFTRHSL